MWVAALVAHLAILKPALILAGSAAEHGEGSGMLPYLLGAAGWARTYCPPSPKWNWARKRIDALQALPGGAAAKTQRAATLPGYRRSRGSGPRGRAAFAKARRGRIQRLDFPAGPPEAPSTLREIPTPKAQAAEDRDRRNRR